MNRSRPAGVATPVRPDTPRGVNRLLVEHATTHRTANRRPDTLSLIEESA